MENKTVKTYKLWHMLLVFTLGAVVSAGVFMMPSEGGQGFISREKVISSNTLPTLDNAETKVACSLTICDIAKNLVNHEVAMVSLLHPITGSLGRQLDRNFSIVVDSKNSMVGLLHPVTGQLGIELKMINEKLDKIIGNL